MGSLDGLKNRTSCQYQVAIADDNELMREGTASVIGREKEFSICGFAVDRNSVATLVAEKQPDLLLLSLFLGNCDGLDLLKDFAARFPRTRLIVIGVAKIAGAFNVRSI